MARPSTLTAAPAIAATPSTATPSTATPPLWRGLALVGVAVVAAVAVNRAFASIPMIVAAVLVGAVVGNIGLAGSVTAPGLRFASKTVLRFGIVLLGLRLSLGDVAGLGVRTMVVVVATVSVTFFGVQALGRKLGLSRGLSLLVASGFSICGNSAIASVKGASDAEDEEVAAAVGLVTLCGTAAVVVLPAIASSLGLNTTEVGVWTGASVQDTAQVIAVASSAGTGVLAIATAVKLTRVLFLAPIVAGVSLWNRRTALVEADAKRPALLPLFVLGFLATMVARTFDLVPTDVLGDARVVERYALAAGMVGLGSSVRLASLRQLGARPLLLGAAAWLIVASVSLLALKLLNIS